MPRPEKHSLTLHGHRTSVTLEAEFWQSFCQIARERGVSVNALAAEVDDNRTDQGLASAMRLFVLQTLQAK